MPRQPRRLREAWEANSGKASSCKWRPQSQACGEEARVGLRVHIAFRAAPQQAKSLESWRGSRCSHEESPRQFCHLGNRSGATVIGRTQKVVLPPRHLDRGAHKARQEGRRRVCLERSRQVRTRRVPISPQSPSTLAHRPCQPCPLPSAQSRRAARSTPEPLAQPRQPAQSLGVRRSH